MTIRLINSLDLCPPAGHYSHASEGGGLIFLSGQLPIPPHGEHGFQARPFEAQAERALANMFSALAACDGLREHILMVTAYIVGVANWPIFNGVYAGMMGDMRPARVIVPVPELHYGYLVEVSAVAVVAAAAERSA